jgi:hypothetical protein
VVGFSLRIVYDYWKEYWPVPACLLVIQYGVFRRFIDIIADKSELEGAFLKQLDGDRGREHTS